VPVAIYILAAVNVAVGTQSFAFAGLFFPKATWAFNSGSSTCSDHVELFFASINDLCRRVVPISRRLLQLCEHASLCEPNLQR